jgi:hypothetical protein
MGIEPPAFEPEIKFPDEMRFVWEAFNEISRSRQAGFGPSPLLFSEMESWARLNGIDLELWEIDAICRLDVLWMRVINARPS